MAKDPYRIRVDASSRTYLALCSCGWRDCPRSYREAAWLAARVHEENCHPSGLQAAQARCQAARRHAARQRQNA